MLSVSMLFDSTVCNIFVIIFGDFTKLSDWLATCPYFAREAFNFVGRREIPYWILSRMIGKVQVSSP